MDCRGDEGQAHLILHLLHSPFHYTSRNYHLGQGFASFTLPSCRRWRSGSPAPQPPAQQPLAALVTSPDKPRSKVTKINWQYFWMELQEMKERSTPPLSPAQFLQSLLLWLPEFSANSTIELTRIHATNIVMNCMRQGLRARVRGQTEDDSEMKERITCSSISCTDSWEMDKFPWRMIDNLI